MSAMSQIIEPPPRVVDHDGPTTNPAPALDRAKPLKHVAFAKPFDDYVDALPTAIEAVPSMMSVGERTFLYNIAKRYYTGEGRIIDAGIFLGASTACFGAGLAANAAKDAILAQSPRPITSFELGIVNSQMPVSLKRHGVGLDLKAGDSFGPLIEANIAPYRATIDLRLGDITETAVETDERGRRIRSQPIEILFLDVLKSEGISEAAYRLFFPSLIPRRALVIQQDYLNGDLPFIHQHQEFFAKKFEYIGEAGSTAVFRLLHRIKPAEIDELFGKPLDPEHVLGLVAAAAQRSIDPYRRLIMVFSTLRMVLRARGIEAARAFMANAEIMYGAQIADTRFRRVQNVVRACHYLCEHGLEPNSESEAVKISTGHRGSDHRRTDLQATDAAE